MFVGNWEFGRERPNIACTRRRSANSEAPLVMRCRWGCRKTPSRGALAKGRDMSDDCPTSDVLAQRRRERGFSRPRESRRLDAIRQQEISVACC